MAKRVTAGVLAAVLAAVGVYVLVLYVRGAEQRAMAGEEAVEVLVVDEPVAEGTEAEQLAGQVRTEQVPAKVAADGSVDDLDELDGHVAAVDLVPGEQVVQDRFVEPAALERAGEVEIPDGMQVVTVSLSPERTVGGQLAPGDTIGVVASFGDGAGGDAAQGPTSHLVLHKVLVTNVQGGSASGSDDDEGGERAPDGDLLVSLATDAGDAEKVVFAAEHGSLWLTHQPEDADEDGTRIQSLEGIYE